MLNQNVDVFLDDLASSSPAPGGGGASALVGSIGMALGEMVGSLTTGKKRYANVQEDIEDALYHASQLREEMNALILADAKAFEPLATAYGMPRKTDEEKTRRHLVLQTALHGAVDVPLTIARKCNEIVDMLDIFHAKGTQIAISDVAVGAWCCIAAVKGAKLNVLINLKMMDDVEAIKVIEEEINNLDELVEERCLSIVNAITESLTRR